jgi:hypothetical protein
MTKVMSTEERFYVYHIINPITGRLFYVGKGTGCRCKQHLTDKKEYAFNKRLNGYIRNLIESNNNPVIQKIAENLTEEDAYLLEESEIKKYGRVGFEKDGVLLNILDSGRPPKFEGENHPWWGRSHTPETKAKISKTKKENFAKGINKPRSGFTQTPETKEKIGDKNRGRKRTPEAIEKTRQANLGRPQSDHQKKRAEEANSKRWLVIAPDGTEEIVVNLSKYCRERRLNNSSMRLVAYGKQDDYKGYKVKKLD